MLAMERIGSILGVFGFVMATIYGFWTRSSVLGVEWVGVIGFALAGTFTAVFETAAEGFLPRRIWVAPPYTITENDSARKRCEINPDASVDSRMPKIMPGAIRRTMLQSTARWR